MIKEKLALNQEKPRSAETIAVAEKTQTVEQLDFPEKSRQIKDFIAKENRLLEKAASFFKDLKAESVFNRKTKIIAAFSALLKASAIYAGVALAQETEKRHQQTGTVMSENLSAADFAQDDSLRRETVARQNILPFNISEIINKPSIAYEYETLEKDKINIEVIKNIEHWQLQEKTNFFQDLSAQKHNQAFLAFEKNLAKANNAEEFFTKMRQDSALFDNQQKMLMLYQLSWRFKDLYNEEMLRKNMIQNFLSSKTVPDDEIFQNLKQRRDIGVCRDLHYFLTKTANKIGVEAWLQAGFSQTGPHIWSGMVAEHNGKKEIIFINIELNKTNFISTGTMKYKDALEIKIMSDNNEIILFNTYIGSTEEELFPIKTVSAEMMEQASGFNEPDEELSSKLEKGKIISEKFFDIKLSPEKKEIKLNSDHIGICLIDYRNTQNPFNSLDELFAARGSLRLVSENKRLGMESDITYMAYDVRNLGSGAFPREAIVGRLAGNYIRSQKLIKSQFGELALNFGLTIECGLAEYFKTEFSSEKQSGKLDGIRGARLIYASPLQSGKIFFEYQDFYRTQTNNFQDMDIILKRALESFKIGGSVKVQEGTIINLETSRQNLDYGRRYEVKAGVDYGDFSAAFGHKRKESFYRRFVPLANEYECSVGYRTRFKGKPIAEVNFFGALATEQYEDVPEEKSTKIGVKLRLFLFE